MAKALWLNHRNLSLWSCKEQPFGSLCICLYDLVWRMAFGKHAMTEAVFLTSSGCSASTLDKLVLVDKAPGCCRHPKRSGSNRFKSGSGQTLISFFLQFFKWGKVQAPGAVGGATPSLPLLHCQHSGPLEVNAHHILVRGRYSQVVPLEARVRVVEHKVPPTRAPPPRQAHDCPAQ